MNHRLKPSRFLLVLLLLAAPLALLRPAAAGPLTAEATGEVSAFDNGADLLNVNTRTGVRQFQLTTSTLILLNNRVGDQGDIQLRDEVTVLYNYSTGVANTVELTRERRARGTLRAGTGGRVELVNKRGNVLSFTTDSTSRVEVNGIKVDTATALAGLDAVVVYEPGSFLVTSIATEAKVLKGTITAVSSTARTLTVQANKARSFTIDAAATVRRDGVTAQLSALTVGDTVKLVFTRRGATDVAIVIHAKSAPAEPEPASVRGR